MTADQITHHRHHHHLHIEHITDVIDIMLVESIIHISICCLVMCLNLLCKKSTIIHYMFICI